MNRNARIDARTGITNITKTTSAKITLLIFSLSMVFALVVVSYAQPGAQPNTQLGAQPVPQPVVDSGSGLKNFGKINDHLYRGAKPEGDGYRRLAAFGIKTIIDLRDDADFHSRRLAEGAGLQYINIALSSHHPPTEAESDHFLKLVNDEKNWPVYVHCAAGRHRTGILMAIYRMEMDGWDANQAYQEMKEYKFYSRFGHGDLKDYVFEYYARMKARRAALVKQGS